MKTWVQFVCMRGIYKVYESIYKCRKHVKIEVKILIFVKKT